MQWRASVSTALLLLLGVLVDSACRPTESQSISEIFFFKFVAGTLATLLGFLRHWQSHLLPMNECVVRRRSRPPPPLKYYCRQITSRSWESSTTWLSLNYIMLLYCPDFCRPACYRALYSCSVIVALENVVPEGVAFSVNMLIKLLLVFKWPCMYYLTQLK